MAADPFMKRCCISGETGSFQDHVEWHHNLIFAGRQVNEPWAILPLLTSVHLKVTHDQNIKDKCDWIMLNRASDDQLRPYCKAIDYIKRRKDLNHKYGNTRG